MSVQINGSTGGGTMSSIIRIKRSEVAGNPAILAAGELAYSALADNGSNGGDRLYIGMGTETAGNAANHVVIGGKYFTDQITAATSSNTASTLVRRDASGNFSAGTITAALSGNASTSSAWATSRSITINGDADWTVTLDGSSNVISSLTLATTGVLAGTYGGSSAIPVITVDSKGRVTNVSTSSISTTLAIQVGNTFDGINLASDTLTFAGGTGTTAELNTATNTVTFNIAQDVNTTADVQFNNLTLGGYLRGPATFTIDPAAHGDETGTVVIAGNLTVQGTTTTINSNTVAVGDLNIVLAKDATTAAQANGGGISLSGAGATLTYTSADDRWNLNKNLNVGTVYGALSGNASTATALATARTISATGDATWSISFDGSANATAALTLANSGVTAGTYKSVTVDAKGRVTAGTNPTTLSGYGITDAQPLDADLTAIAALSGTSGLLKKTAADTWALDTNTYLTANQTITLSGDVTGSGTTAITATLAATAVTAGSYGSSTSVATFTVDSKGRLTAASSVAIPTATTSVLGLAKFDSTNFLVTAGLVAIATVDGGTY